MEEPDNIVDTPMHQRLQQWWGDFDLVYMQPVFGGPQNQVQNRPRPQQGQH